MSRLSLRARLLLGVLALALAGIVVTDAVTYAELRSFLLTRIDRTLDADRQEVAPPGGPGGPGPGPAAAAVPPGVYLQIRSVGGAVLRTVGGSPLPGSAASPPLLPKRIVVPAKVSGPGLERVARFTVPARGGGGRYRVRASIDPGSPDMIVLATSLGDVDGTLHRLFLTELFVTLAVLLAAGLLGLWVVRLGLRPLEAIGRTAERIVGGDLSPRVERAEPRTEVGRLGLALNSMLDRIEASDRRLRRFVADASHELRTPLAGVRAYAELFERGASARPDDLARAMAGIGRESERMSELVEDLLLLARLDEGQPLEREPVDLAELAAEAVETARAVDPSRPLELEAAAAQVVGDRARLRRVLDNLLGNVRAHTPAGTHARLRIAVEGGEAVIELSDDGPGLPPGEEERIFGRFYRADLSRSRESGGVGLGLSIVVAIVTAHGGTVSAAASAGSGGATFRVRLPSV